MQPVNVFGDTSLAAGAFLVVRQIFADCGADVSDLRPSSLVRPYLSRHSRRAVPAICRMAPARFPRLCVDAPIQSGIGCAVMVAWLMHVAGWFVGPRWWTIVGVICEVLLLPMIYVVGRLERPTVFLPAAPTFRHLCLILAGERCRQGPAFPVVLPPRGPA
jgi:hypothetical protein